MELIFIIEINLYMIFLIKINNIIIIILLIIKKIYLFRK